ncbi:MAG: 50S ribosomal protein L4 [Candidatus Micrarchaeia archaeon]
MKVPIYSIEGKEINDVELPIQFNEEYREDLIRRAVLSEESKMRQPKGSYKFAGLETSAEYRGEKETYGSLKNRGQAMLPREIKPEGGWGRVRRIPSSVKGRRAHPPKVEKIIIEKMNNREYQKAMRSALASSTINEVINNRYNIGNRKVPIIIENNFEKLGKSREVLSVFSKLNLSSLIENAKKRQKRKTGVGKTRTKRMIKTPKYLLVVVDGGEILKAARGLCGVDVVRVSDLKVRHLAPGAFAGRVVVYTENAIKTIGEKL